MNTHKEEPKKWKPESSEYWYVDHMGDVTFDNWRNDQIDKWNAKTGNCFHTEEEAEKHKEYLIKEAEERLLGLVEPTPPSQIEEDPKIVQIAPVFTDKFNYLFGLGADGKPYYWDAKEEYWRYYDDQYGRHLDWELEQKFKEVNNTK